MKNITISAEQLNYSNWQMGDVLENPTDGKQYYILDCSEDNKKVKIQEIEAGGRVKGEFLTGRVSF